MDTIKTITAKAPINIAVIKYWGKQDDQLNIPLNDSISATISMDEICTTTSIAMSDKFDSNKFFLNGRQIDWNELPRLNALIEKLKEVLAKQAGDKTKFKWQNMHICSKNNFPTAAGVASSASGYACLAYTLCKMFNIDDPYVISRLARIGSGSACRSIFGGFVQWYSGHNDETSHAKQIMSEDKWPDLRVLILIASTTPKEVPSTKGMILSKKTSEMLQHRIKILHRRIEQMSKALDEKNFDRFAELTMKDSNQFHAICLDTYPPIRYLANVSWTVINFVHFINNFYQKNVVAYTFDAGSNATIFCEADRVPELITLFQMIFPQIKCENENVIPVKGIQYEKKMDIDPKIVDYIKANVNPNSIECIYSTKIGTGPKIITEEFDDQCLLKPDGLPK